MIQLRLLVGVFRLVLTGEAPELVRFYPCLVPRSLSLFTVRAAQAPPSRRSDAIVGAVHPGPFEIVARTGCDLSPVNAATADGQLLLTSFVWPFDLDRHRRLEAALAIAASHQVRVDKASASEWLPRALRVAEPQTLTVVWHSITQMHWSANELGAVETVLASSGAKQCLGEVGLEFDPNGPPGAEPELRTRLWTPAAGLTPRQRVIGTAHYQGVPATLAGEDSLKI
jgi:hypothetical protein